MFRQMKQRIIIMESNAKTKVLHWLKTPEYQISTSFCIGISMFGSFCDDHVNNNANKSLSHHEYLIYCVTKGFFIGLTYPISFPMIAFHAYRKIINLSEEMVVKI